MRFCTFAVKNAAADKKTLKKRKFALPSGILKTAALFMPKSVSADQSAMANAHGKYSDL
jgi:hypothetical protein